MAFKCKTISMANSRPNYEFLLDKNRSSVKYNVVCGLTFPQWIRYWWGNWHLFDFRYVHRVIFITIMSIFNSCLAVFEDLLFREQFRRHTLNPSPIFILGHPRTGTTHLHNLLSLDENFCVVQTIDVAFPNSFVFLRAILPNRVFHFIESLLVEKTRPMDALPLDLSTPAEDEIATNVLSGGISPYAALSFMPRYKHYLQFLSFRGCCQNDIERWKESFLWFLKKVSFVNNGKPMIIKSPPHTARVDLLRRVFPNARFVWIHRHPQDVFVSSCHMAQEYFTYCFLTKTTNEQLTDYTLEQHDIIYKEILKNREFIQCELSYRELEENPFEAVDKIYSALGMNYQLDRTKIQEYLDALSFSGFKKNDHKKLDDNLLHRVRQSTENVARELHYQGD